MAETLWFLKRCDIFARLSPAEADRLERSALMRRFRKREIIYFPHDRSETVFLVASGRVTIKDITPDGRETILAFIGEGEIFGELALLDSQPRNEYAEAAEDSQVIVIARDELLRFIEQRPLVSLRVTKLVGLRRRRIENRLRSILFRSNRERLGSLLIELADSYGEQVGDRWEIGLRLSHQELASLIGATRETVTLTLGQLQLEGLIRVQRRRVTILDRDRLASEFNGVLASSCN